MDNNKKLVYGECLSHLNEAASSLARILHIERNGLTVAEAGNPNALAIAQLRSIEKKIRAIEIALNF